MHQLGGKLTFLEIKYRGKLTKTCVVINNYIIKNVDYININNVKFYNFSEVNNKTGRIRIDAATFEDVHVCTQNQRAHFEYVTIQVIAGGDQLLYGVAIFIPNFFGRR